VISGFVDIYNEEHGCRYERSECLDVIHRNSRQPEVLLKCAGQQDLVVERKTVVWPENYIRDHKGFHHLGNELSRRLGQRFRDNPHVLIIQEESLSNTENFQRATDEICSAIERGDVNGCKPFAWRLSPARNFEYLLNGDVHGIGIVANGKPGPWHNTPEKIMEIRSQTLVGFQNACRNVIVDARKKFEDYSRARRILLLQFISDTELVFDEDIEGILKSSIHADDCNEVWVAFHEWLNESDYQVNWRRLWMAQS